MSSNTDSVTHSAGTNSSERFIGRVKWFNNKAGYGFISITDGVQSGTDVFIHHSAIGVSSEQYKYLIQGEYVTFCLSETQNETHKFQASNVLGINGGKLMCETRREFKISRSSYIKDNNEDSSEPVKTPRQPRTTLNESTQTPRPNKPKYQKTTQTNGNWTPVTKK